MPTSIGIVDVWGISNANKFDTACIEVKVSRNDYRSKSQNIKNCVPIVLLITVTCYAQRA
jgi:hypothetical protein